MRRNGLSSISATTTATTSTQRSAPARRATNRLPKNARRPPRPQRARASLTTPPAALVPVSVPMARGMKVYQKDGACTVVNREKFESAEFVSSTDNATRLINPKNATLFPWASKMAACYDMYHINRLTFEYVSHCPTTTNGILCMAIDYDPTDANNTTPLASLQQYGGAVTTQLYMGASLTWKEASTVMKNHKYFTKASGTADRLADVGTFVWKVVPGVQTDTGTTYGELFVNYSITFYDPETNPQSLSLLSSVSPLIGADNVATTATNELPLGTLDDIRMLIQNPGMDVTSMVVKLAKTKAGMKLISSAFAEILEKAGLTTYFSGFNSGWKDLAGNSVSFTNINDGIYFVLPAWRAGDLVVIWYLVGTWAPAVAQAPVVAFHGHNITYTQINNRPWTTASPRITDVNGHDTISGSICLHVIDPDAPVAFSLYLPVANGTWSAVYGHDTTAGGNSHITVLPAASFVNDQHY